MDEDSTFPDRLTPAVRPAEPEGTGLINTLDAIPQLVWSARPDGRHDFYNRKWFEFTGLGARPDAAGPWGAVIHPDDLAGAQAAWRESLASGADFEAEYRLRHHSGAWRWILARALPLREADGTIMRWYGTCTPIEAIIQRQGRLAVLAGELSHRIKNVFAVVNSIITLSARDAPEARPFAAALSEQIKALARANSHLRADRPGDPAEGPQPAAPGLLPLLQALMEPYSQGETSRVLVRGTDHAIGEQAATGLALIIHELATNAVKYGALSVPDGRVRIDHAVDEVCLQLVWQESGGPWQAAPPTGSGFGTSMTERVSRDQLQAEVTRNWRPEGLELTMRIPLERLAG